VLRRLLLVVLGRLLLALRRLLLLVLRRRLLLLVLRRRLLLVLRRLLWRDRRWRRRRGSAALARGWQIDLIAGLQLVRVGALVALGDLLEVALLALADAEERVAFLDLVRALAHLLVLRRRLLLVFRRRLLLVLRR